jgi:aspartyl protease family protein
MRFLGIYLVAILLAVGVLSYVTNHRPMTSQSRPVLAAALVHSPAATSAAPALAPPTQILEDDHFGHYVTPVQVDGHELHMLVDTGATLIALTSEDAGELGLRPTPSDFTIRVQTANGVSTAAPTWLPHVRVGAVEVHDVQAVIMSPGAMSRSLLGMSFLSKLRHFGVSDGKMRLEQ